MRAAIKKKLLSYIEYSKYRESLDKFIYPIAYRKIQDYLCWKIVNNIKHRFASGGADFESTNITYS